jgi:hypothetical protein
MPDQKPTSSERTERFQRATELSGKIERLEKVLLHNMQREAPALQQLLDDVNKHHTYEDRLYRFYHQSFKIYDLQETTQQITAALTTIAPENQPFCDFFQTILRAGTGRKFELEDNHHWVERAAPIVQAFLHARYFLEMAVKYGAQLEKSPQRMPSGWAALLELYGIR